MKRRQAFTLVELLVAISIVATLLAMVMPALSLARRKARTAACMNNLRQLGQAMSQYKSEQSDFFPARLNESAALLPDPAGSWSLLPTAYAGQSAPNMASFARYCGDTKILHCPELGGASTDSYGLNGRVINVVQTFKQIPNPSSTPLVFDTRIPVGYYYGDLDNRHLGHANIMYADTHVRTEYIDVLFGFAGATPLPGVNAGPAEASTPPDGSTFTFELRIAGSPWDTVDFILNENGQEFARVTAQRSPGNPNQQTVTMGPHFLSPGSKTYTIHMNLTINAHGNGKGKGQGQGGGNPVWISVGGGGWNKLATLNKNKPAATVDITSMLAATQ